MCLARCSYEGGPATGRGRLARDRRYRGQWRHRKRKRKRIEGKGALEWVGSWIANRHVAAHGHFETISPSEHSFQALDRHRDCSRSDTAIGASYSYKIEYPTHPRPVYTQDQIIQECQDLRRDTRAVNRVVCGCVPCQVAVDTGTNTHTRQSYPRAILHYM